MANYPQWFCPVFLCSYSTTYYRNIRKHLVRVHGFSKKAANSHVDAYSKAHYSGALIVNDKSPRDPTNPVHFSPKASTTVSSERSERSVVGGGQGG